MTEPEQPTFDGMSVSTRDLLAIATRRRDAARSSYGEATTTYAAAYVELMKAQDDLREAS